MASLYKKHDGEKAQHLDSQTGALLYDVHERILVLVSLSNQSRHSLVPSRRESRVERRICLRWFS